MATPDPTLLTAAEAASRLGVKRQTLYAYVSRGVIARELSLDGRTSLFRAEDVDSLRSAHRRTSSGEVESVIASSITKVDEAGHSYRGVPAIELADGSLEDTAELLWGGESQPWVVPDEAIAAVRALQASLPDDVALIDRLRGSVLALSAHDQLRHDPTPDGHRRAGRLLLTSMVDGLPFVGGTDHHAADRPGAHERLADRLWPRLSARPSDRRRRDCLNAALVLLADHGLAASTFAARIAASVRADPYSIVSSGLGAMGGVLHGAASEGVHRLLDEAHAIGPETAIGQHLRDGRSINGVGHAVYRSSDPREIALTERIGAAWDGDDRLQTVQATRAILQERTSKGPINVDFALGSLTWLADMEPGGGQCIFVARAAGWIAHGIEEMDERPLRFRAVARWRPSRPPLPEDHE